MSQTLTMGFTIATGFCVKPHVPSSVSPPSPTSSSSAFVSSSPPKKQMRRRAASKLPQTCQLQSPNTVPPPSPPTDNKDDRSLWSNLTDFKNIRKLLFLLSTMGIAETSYLTLNKLFSSPGAICSTEGCLEVLSGPFSTFLGVPLTLFGGLAYSLFAYLCVWPLTANDEERESKDGSEATFEVIPADEIYASRDASTRPLMLGLSTILFIFSLYLMAVLYFIIQAMCPYCVFSAVLAAVIFTLTAFVGRAVPNWRVALGVGAVSTAIAGTAASVMFLVALPQQLRAQPPSEPQLPPAITMSSSSETMKIAQKLRDKNAKMYGAYWCAHCFDQKQRFGKKAFAKLQYIECDKYGVNTQYKLCRTKRIPGYPTWEINGELFPGEIDIKELERLAEESTK